MKNIAIFASGNGTNAENIAKHLAAGDKGRVSVVIANKKNAGVHARMKALGIPTLYFPNAVWDGEPELIVRALEPYGIDLVVLAGFMREVKKPILEAFPHRVINIHPALLPKYGGVGMFGHHVHEAVIAAGERESGVTVHFVNEQIDGGDIILQQRIELTAEDTPQTLETKIHPVEYELYPKAIDQLLSEMETEDEGKDSATEVKENKDTAEPPIPPAPEVPSAPSVDSAWAECLHLPYDEQTAAANEAKENNNSNEAGEAAGQATLPPDVPGIPPIPEEDRRQNYAEQPGGNMKMPRSYLAWSILMTIVCCTVCGIVAIIYSASVNSKVSMGLYEQAERASRRAQGWIIASFVLGLLYYTIMLPFQLFSGWL